MTEKTLILLSGGDQAKIAADLGLMQTRIGDIMFIGPYTSKQLTPIEQKLKDAETRNSGMNAYFFPVRVEHYPGRVLEDDAPLC